MIQSKRRKTCTEIRAMTRNDYLLAAKMNFLNLSAITFIRNALSIFMVLSIKMEMNVTNTVERQQTPKLQVKFVGLARVRTDTEKDSEIVIKRIKLSSRFAAFTKGVFRYLYKMAPQMETSEKPTEANRIMRTDVILDHFDSTSGKSKHFHLPSLGICPRGHFVQLTLLTNILKVPAGHLMHSQQQAVVLDRNVPGGQSP